VAENKDIDNAILRRKDECDTIFLEKDTYDAGMKDLWSFARSRAHKGMTWLVVGLFAILISVGVGQFYWVSGKFEKQSEKMHALDMETALQLQGLQAQQKIIVQGIADINRSINTLTEAMIGPAQPGPSE